MGEFFIVANSNAAPFFSDTMHAYAKGADANAALIAYLATKPHPCGMYAAVAYASADAHHKGEEPLARWLSEKAMGAQKEA